MDYNKLASQESIDKTVKMLAENGMEGIVVATKEEALATVTSLIPPGVSVMNGASRTLEQIGFIDYLKQGSHGWNNLHEGIVMEKDPAKQALLRKQATISDYYLGSVHALSETGEFIIASNTGSQLPNIVFGSQHLIFVVGAQKIVPTLTEAMHRLEQHVIPLEDARMKEVYGVGTMLSKMVTFRRENAMMGRSVRIIIVQEILGF